MTFIKQKYYESEPRYAKIIARRIQKQKADNIQNKGSFSILQYKQEELQISFENYQYYIIILNHFYRMNNKWRPFLNLLIYLLFLRNITKS